MNHLQFASNCITTRAKHQGQGLESVNIFLFYINNLGTSYTRTTSHMHILFLSLFVKVLILELERAWYGLVHFFVEHFTSEQYLKSLVAHSLPLLVPNNFGSWVTRSLTNEGRDATLHSCLVAGRP